MIKIMIYCVHREHLVVERRVIFSQQDIKCLYHLLFLFKITIFKYLAQKSAIN